MMRRITVLLVSLFIVFSCSSTNSEEKKAIETYLETDRKGDRYNLDIKFDEFKLSDVTVSDSIKLLQEKFSKEKERKLNNLEIIRKEYEKNIEKHTNQNTLVSKYSLKLAQRKLEKQLEKIEEAKKWEPEYLLKYNDRDKSEVLNKKAEAIIRFENPKLKVEQTVHANFYLTKDGSKCLDMERIKDKN